MSASRVLAFHYVSCCNAISECRLFLQPSWRRPKGIDSRVRRQFKGCILMPNIGYGSNKKTRHMLPSGFRVFPVRRPADLDMLLMHNK